MKYEQFIKRVEEGDLVGRYGVRTFEVIVKEELGVTTFDNRYIAYEEITGLWKLDSKGNYIKVEVER